MCMYLVSFGFSPWEGLLGFPSYQLSSPLLARWMRMIAPMRSPCLANDLCSPLEMAANPEFQADRLYLRCGSSQRIVCSQLRKQILTPLLLRPFLNFTEPAMTQSIKDPGLLPSTLFCQLLRNVSHNASHCARLFRRITKVSFWFFQAFLDNRFTFPKSFAQYAEKVCAPGAEDNAHIRYWAIIVPLIGAIFVRGGHNRNPSRLSKTHKIGQLIVQVRRHRFWEQLDLGSHE